MDDNCVSIGGPGAGLAWVLVHVLGLCPVAMNTFGTGGQTCGKNKQIGIATRLPSKASFKFNCCKFFLYVAFGLFSDFLNQKNCQFKKEF